MRVNLFTINYIHTVYIDHDNDYCCFFKHHYDVLGIIVYLLYLCCAVLYSKSTRKVSKIEINLE